MRVSKSLRAVAPVAGVASLFWVIGTASAAVTFSGNGATGFGGTLGNGSLTLSDAVVGGVPTLTATFNPSGGFTGNDVVAYIDSTTGGFADTSNFSDNGDDGRKAISANNNGNPSRDLISFPAGFTADYALEFENNTFIGLFQLVSGGNGSLNFVGGTSPTPGGPYTVSFPLSSIGVTPGSSFGFVADLISTSGYGSNETIGASSTTSDVGAAPNAGFNGSTAFTAANTFTTTPVPEPAMLSMLAAAGLLLGRRRR